MKICICTTPIRPQPTNFPPFGSMAIIQSLRQIGEEVHFYNIDYFRYRHEEIATYFTENQFDVVGISAVVSTAYAYTKYLANLIRTVSPNTVIIVGGNLAASAEILLRKCQVDFCVVGDGELIIQNLITVLYEQPRNYVRLKSTKGISFLDENDRFYFTGYGPRPSAKEIAWPDYNILGADGSISHFIGDEQIDSMLLSCDRPVRPGEKMATVEMTKGCVARCTFCHRWERGFRARPVDQIIQHIQYLKDHYNVRYIDVADENFGSDHKKAKELATLLGKMDIAWRVAGVRARTVTPEALAHWKANGCASVFYGIESGSQKILDVMEKNVTVEQNIAAVKWAYEAGLYTIIQLVVGMPGETDQTIQETTEFLKTITPYLFLDNKLPSGMTSVNYAQALPGTTLYEYARQHRFIGKNIDKEEQYLLKISDTNAYKTDHFINYTSQPLLKVLMWRPLMLAEVDAYYLKQTIGSTPSLLQLVRYFSKRVVKSKDITKSRFGLFLQRLLLKFQRNQADELPENDSGRKEDDFFTKSGYFNIHAGNSFAPLLLNPLTRLLFYPLLAIGVAIFSTDYSPPQASLLLVSHLYWSLTRRFRSALDLPDKSLRKIVTIEPATTEPNSEDMMIPLRLGR